VENIFLNLSVKSININSASKISSLKHCLYLIKQKFGGSVKLKAGDNHLRYRLHHKIGLLNLIKAVNGLIRNPVRMLQLGKICENYNIDLIDPQPLTYYNGWFAGFFDSDGSVYIIKVIILLNHRFCNLRALLERGKTLYYLSKI